MGRPHQTAVQSNMTTLNPSGYWPSLIPELCYQGYLVFCTVLYTFVLCWEGYIYMTIKGCWEAVGRLTRTQRSPSWRGGCLKNKQRASPGVARGEGVEHLLSAQYTMFMLRALHSLCHIHVRSMPMHSFCFIHKRIVATVSSYSQFKTHPGI